MCASRSIAVALVAALAGPCLATRAVAADQTATPAPVQLLQPYDAAPQPPAQRPQASDAETPRLTPAPPRETLWQPQGPLAERRVSQVEDPDPSEPGLIVGESLAALFTTTFGVVPALVAGGWPLLAGPLVTGGLVCAIGHASDVYDGRCGAAIGGAYVGALMIIPMAVLFNAADQNGSDDGGLPGVVVGAVLGYVLGTTVGAVVGWNVSRELKPERVADADLDAGRLDGLAAARLQPWTDPLRVRAATVGPGEARLSTTLVAFRF